MTSGNTVDNQNSFGSANATPKANANTARKGARSNSNTDGMDAKELAVKRPAKRGCAAMDPERQRQIAAQGGRAAHESGNAHQFTSEEARAAGKKSHSSHRSSAGVTTGRRSIGNLQSTFNPASPNS